VSTLCTYKIPESADKFEIYLRKNLNLNKKKIGEKLNLATYYIFYFIYFLSCCFFIFCAIVISPKLVMLKVEYNCTVQYTL
jgi:hypothetical protein